MIRLGRNTSHRTRYTTSEVLADMAERSGRYIEFTRDAAFLELNGCVWIAPLPPTMEVKP